MQPTHIAFAVAAFLSGLFLGMIGSKRRKKGEGVYHLLYNITQKLNDMATKAEFEAAFQVVTDALNNIGDDITRLTEQLQDGSLTEAEEADVLAQLTALGDRAKEIAGRTPEQQEPTEPVEPTEPTEPEA